MATVVTVSSSGSRQHLAERVPACWPRFEYIACQVFPPGWFWSVACFTSAAAHKPLTPERAGIDVFDPARASERDQNGQVVTCCDYLCVYVSMLFSQPGYQLRRRWSTGDLRVVSRMRVADSQVVSFRDILWLSVSLRVQEMMMHARRLIPRRHSMGDFERHLVARCICGFLFPPLESFIFRVRDDMLVDMARQNAGASFNTSKHYEFLTSSRSFLSPLTTEDWFWYERQRVRQARKLAQIERMNPTILKPSLSFVCASIELRRDGQAARALLASMRAQKMARLQQQQELKALQ